MSFYIAEEDEKHPFMRQLHTTLTLLFFGIYIQSLLNFPMWAAHGRSKSPPHPVVYRGMTLIAALDHAKFGSSLRFIARTVLIISAA